MSPLSVRAEPDTRPMSTRLRHHTGVPKRAETRSKRAVIDRPVAISLVLAALTAAVYAPVRTFELVNWDDPSYLTDNPIVRGGLSWSSAWWALTTTHSPYWHPMTWLSLLVDVSLFGDDAGAYHVTSVAIHIATTIVLFLLLRRITGASGPSGFVAAIFAVHPLHVESVAWIAERKDVLSTFFWALTIWAYVSYTRAPSVRAYLLVVLWYALALMSKPMVMTLPVVLLLLDWWPLGRWGRPTGVRTGGGRPDSAAQVSAVQTPVMKTSVVQTSVARTFSSVSARRLVLEKLPLFALAIAVAIETMIVQRRVGAVAGLEVLPVGARIENAIVSYVIYMWKTVWPSNLAAFYPLHAYPTWAVLAAAVALIAITVCAAIVRTRLPYITIGWLWFLVTVAPVIGLTQAGEQARADRFMYVPMIGLLLIAAFSRWPAGVRKIRVFVAALLIVASSVAARAQVLTWANGEVLWRHAIAAVSGNYVAYENLGEWLRDHNRYDEALASLRLALSTAPPN